MCVRRSIPRIGRDESNCQGLILLPAVTLAQSLKQRLVYHVVRPLVSRAPTGAWVAATHVASWIGAPVVAWRQAPALGRVLQVCGHPDTPRKRLGLARATLYQRLRKLDFYMHGRTRDPVIAWNGEAPGRRPCCYVMLDTFGAENVAAFADDFAAWAVRQRFGGEGELTPSSAPSGRRWTAHCAQLRQAISQGRVIDVAARPIELRRLIEQPRNVIVFQGNLDHSGRAATRRVLGQAVPMPLGAVRLARRAGMPLRFMRVQPSGTRWDIVVEPAMPAEEPALVARIERELRERPETWMLWSSFLAAADAAAGEPAVSSSLPAAGSAPGSAA